MQYEQFISSIKTLRDEATQLFGREQLHEDRQFRRWRNELTDLIARISEQGFRVNCRVSVRAFDQLASPDTHRNKKDRIAAYDRDLLDTINELDILIKRHSEVGVPSAASSPPVPAVSSSEVISKFKQHWFVSLVALCSVVVIATWAIAHQLFVAPRDFEIARLKEALAEAQRMAAEPRGNSVAAQQGKLLLSNKGVAVGNSITTPDGACTVRVVSLLNGVASLEVAVNAEEPQIVEQARIGQRLVVRGAKQIYYIDLHRERGGMVDLSVSSAAVAEQALAADARKPSRG